MLDLDLSATDDKLNLNDLIKRFLIAFCELNVTFKTRLDIYGSVHVLSDNSEISSILLNEHSFKNNYAGVDQLSNNLMKDKSSLMKKRVLQKCEKSEPPDEEEILIEKEWNDPIQLPQPSTSDGNITIKKFNYSNQLITSKSKNFKLNKLSAKKLKLSDDKTSSEVPIIDESFCGERECLFSALTQGKKGNEEQPQSLVNSSLNNVLLEEVQIKNENFQNGFASFSSQSIFPEPELVCTEDLPPYTLHGDICGSSTKTDQMNTKMEADNFDDEVSFTKLDIFQIKSEQLDKSDVKVACNIQQDHNNCLTASSIESCFPQFSDFLTNFLAASRLLQLNSITVTNASENNGHRDLFKCLICPSSFPTFILFQDHLRQHYDNFQFPIIDANQSGDCSENFNLLPTPTTSTDFSLAVSGPNKLFCVICNLTFRSLDGLKCHINSKHSLQKTYKCRFCPKLFLTRQAAYSHRVKFHSIQVTKK